MTVDIHLLESLTANREKQERVNESLATQLQRSMELNARMKNRLQKILVDVDEILMNAIQNIINDKEPEL